CIHQSASELPVAAKRPATPLMASANSSKSLNVVFGIAASCQLARSLRARFSGLHEFARRVTNPSCVGRTHTAGQPRCRPQSLMRELAEKRFVVGREGTQIPHAESGRNLPDAISVYIWIHQRRANFSQTIDLEQPHRPDAEILVEDVA